MKIKCLTHRIMLNSAIAYEKQLNDVLQLHHSRWLTVKAVPTVNWLPCITYAKNAVTETRIGAMLHMRENSTLLIRAGVSSDREPRKLHTRSTFDHPLHLDFASIHSPFDPAVLPGKELDELNLKCHNSAPCRMKALRQ